MNVQLILQAIADKTGWKQAELARRLGVTQPSISRWLNGTDMTYAQGLKLESLAVELGILTNGTRTKTMTSVVQVAGVLGMNDAIEWRDEGARPIAELPFPLPDGCIGLEILVDTSRARKGDLLVAGPMTGDLEGIAGKEGVIETESGFYYGTVIPSRDGLYTVMGSRSIVAQDAVIRQFGPYCATIAADRWKLMG